MDKNEVKQIIASNIQLSLSGQDVEHAKLDFKKEWYNLKDEKGVSAFIKDCSAIANTAGPDGYLVIGFDTKTQKFNPVKFSDSGLRDGAELPGIIVRHVDRSFIIDYFPVEIDGNILNVIHIPPSLDKPHFIRNHKSWPGGNLREEVHRVFVRKGSTIREATRYDLDVMIYDRKNIVAPAELNVTFDMGSLFAKVKPGDMVDGIQPTEIIFGSLGMTIENTGDRAIPIKSMILYLAQRDEDFPGDWLILHFNRSGRDPNKILVIGPHSLTHHDLSFESSNRLSPIAREALTRLMEFTTKSRFLILKDFQLFTTNNAKFQLNYQKTEDQDLLSFPEMPVGSRYP